MFATLARLVRPETLYFLLVWAVALVAFRERGFYDPGALWHVKVGEIVLDHGPPHTDPFTYTFAGRTWIPQQWGAEVVMALLHRAGGFDTMLLGFATLLAGLATWLFHRGRAAGMGGILAGLVVGLGLFTGAFHYYVRPHMATIAFLAWTMACVVDYEAGRASIRRLAWLVPLGVVWLNLHGGVWGGTATLGLAVAGWVLWWQLSVAGWWGGGAAKAEPPAPDSAAPPPHHPAASPVKNWKTAFLLCGIVVAHGLTAFVNPFGLEMLRTWRRILGSKVMPEIINEHMPLDPTSAPGLAVIGFGVFYLLMLAGTLPNRVCRAPGLSGSGSGSEPGARSPADPTFRVSWLVPLAWLVLSFKGIRQGPLFAVTALVAVIDLWPHTVWHRLLLKYGDTLVRRPEDGPARCGWQPVGVAAVAVLAAFGLQAAKVPAPLVGYGWVRFDPMYVPADMIDPVQQYAESVPSGTRIFNDANLGGFLIYFAPRLKIFMDDRCELYGDPWMREYVDRMELPPEEFGPRFEDWWGQYGFDRAIVMTAPEGKDPPPVEVYLSGSPHWREVARGKRAAMYERVHR